ncbi:uncharacterized protein LJ206_019675 [Theristicus caerulescens]
MGANLPCSHGAGCRRGRLGTPGTQASVSLPSPSPISSWNRRDPGVLPPPAPPFGGSGAQLQTRCCGFASIPGRTRRPRPRPRRPLPARAKGPRGTPTPGNPPRRGKAPAGPRRVPGLRGAPRSLGCRHPRQQPAIAPGPEPGTGPRPPEPGDEEQSPAAAGSAGAHHRARSGRQRRARRDSPTPVPWGPARPAGGWVPAQGFPADGDPTCPEFLRLCRSEARGEGGSRGRNGAGSPKPRGALGRGVPGPAHVAPGAVLSPPGTATPPRPRRASCPAEPGVPLPARARGPQHPDSPICRTATPCRSSALAARHRPARGDGAWLM